MPRRHVVDSRRDETDSGGARVFVDFALHTAEGEGHGQELPGEIGQDTPTCHVAPAMWSADEDGTRHNGQRLEEKDAAEKIAGLVREMRIIEGLHTAGEH